MGISKILSGSSPASACTPPASQNLIYAQNIYMGIKEGRNLNTLVIGSAGSGKTFGLIRPNIYQMNTSYVITDPKGEIFSKSAKLLMENGYKVWVFSTADMAFSHCYNPFNYVYDVDGNIDESQVTSMITMFLENSSSRNAKKGDEFWTKSAQALLTSIIMYLLEFRPAIEHDMYHVLKLVQMGRVDDNNNNSSNQGTLLDQAFSRAKAQNPNAKCFSSYETFKLAPPQTANSILISAAVDLNKFNEDKVRNLTSTSFMVSKRNSDGTIKEYKKDLRGNYIINTDETIDLNTIGDEKTALFINIPAANATYNFLVSMLYSQLFNTLYNRAEKMCPKKYMLLDGEGFPLLSMFDSEEQAERYRDLYASAEVVNKKGRWVIYNSEAKKSESIPGRTKGELKLIGTEMMDDDICQRIAQNFINKMKSATIKKGAMRLPWHVQCLLDEFSNIGEIPEFPEKLATMRQYEISCMIIIQSLAQLKNRYDKLFGDIINNCSATIYLGGIDQETCKYISETLGTRTTKIKGESHSYGGKSGGSQNISLDSRELMKASEVAKLDKDYCIVIVAGENPFKAKKYWGYLHPMFEYTGDNKEKPENILEIKDYITCQNKLYCPPDIEASVKKNVKENKNADGDDLISGPVDGIEIIDATSIQAVCDDGTFELPDIDDTTAKKPAEKLKSDKSESNKRNKALKNGAKIRNAEDSFNLNDLLLDDEASKLGFKKKASNS